MATLELIQQAERKITVKEFFEMELEEGYFYELINVSSWKNKHLPPRIRMQVWK